MGAWYIIRVTGKGPIQGLNDCSEENEKRVIMIQVREEGLIHSAYEEKEREKIYI